MLVFNVGNSAGAAYQDSVGVRQTLLSMVDQHMNGFGDQRLIIYAAELMPIFRKLRHENNS